MNLLHQNDRPGEYPPSWYAATATPLDPFPALSGSDSADVCVVGAGYAGLSAALHLARAGRRVVVLEAQRVGFGASGRNGGQVGSGQRRDQDELERMVGRATARVLWDMAEEAKALVRSLLDDPADWRPGVAHACYGEGEVTHAHRYAERLARDYGYSQLEPLDGVGIRRLIGSTAFAGGEVDRGAGHIHPLNYAKALARACVAAGVTIHERSEVTAIRQAAQPTVLTAGGQVTAGNVILAGNGYLGNLEPRVAQKVMPINNFIIATEPLGDRAAGVLAEPVAVADTKFVVNYWRLSHDNRLLFGGGESYGYRFPDIIATVRPAMLKIYPQLADVRIDHAWGGTLSITMNRMPAFQRLGGGLWSISSCSGHGVAAATLAGKIAAEAVTTTTDRFDLMAGLPLPSFPGGATLRWPLLVLAMTWYAMRDRLGL
jgi:gamma-glutamylputrescine oxidase